MNVDHERLRPRNLRHLVILMGVQLGLLVAVSGFELLTVMIAARVHGQVHVTTALVATLGFAGLATGFGHATRALWHGRRWAFRRTGPILVAEGVLCVVVLLSGGRSGCLAFAVIAAALAIALCGRLYLMPDVAAYVGYREDSGGADSD